MSMAVIEVANTGARNSDYTVSLGTCTHPVVAMASQTANLNPNDVEELVFEVQLSRAFLCAK